MYTFSPDAYLKYYEDKLSTNRSLSGFMVDLALSKLGNAIFDSHSKYLYCGFLFSDDNMEGFTYMYNQLSWFYKRLIRKDYPEAF